MEGELEQLIKDRAYEQVLARTAEVLAVTPDSGPALAYRGRALASLQRYDEASEVLRAALGQVRNAKRRTAIHSLDQVCRAILNIDKAYATHRHESEVWQEDWYSRSLSEVVCQSQETTDPQFLEKLWSGQDLDCSSVYILGPATEVNSFHNVDCGVNTSVREPLPRFPTAQADGSGCMYLRRQTFLCPFGFPKRMRGYRDRGPQPIAVFPVRQWESRGQHHQPNLKCDVFYSTDAVEITMARLLRWSLDRLAAQRQDFFVPQYHNIIDPNLAAVLDSSLKEYRWTATDFLVKEVKVPRKATVISLQGCIRRSLGRGLPWHSIQLILSYSGHTLPFGRAHLASPLPLLPLETHRELAVAVESILTAALPFVAALRRPALLLPGKLQAVVKAQSIYLDPGEEYEGVWHYDGLNEDIVAVVLYYYRYSPQLEGGDLEFVSRKPRDEEFWLSGDCNPDSLNKEDVEKFLGELPRVRIPMQEGTLAVFSNYQVVHRVLRMVNRSDQVASSDFLVLFLVDQRSPLLSTQHLPQFLDKRASESVRERLFFDQLKPSGQFGVYDNLIYSTGNGSCALLGWMEKNDNAAFLRGSAQPRPGQFALKQLSESPPLHRGASWILDPDQWDSEERKLLELKSFLAQQDSASIQAFLVHWTGLGSQVQLWNWTLKYVSIQQLQDVTDIVDTAMQIMDKAMEDPEVQGEVTIFLKLQKQLKDLQKQATALLDEHS